MKYSFLFGLVFLSGCHGMPLFKALPISNTAVYAIGGQSNAAYMGERQAEYIRQSLGAVAVVNCGYPRTGMIRWTLGGDQYLGCVNEINLAIAAHPGSTLKGILFWQGESDCTSVDAVLWVGRFTAMVQGFRTYWQDVPVVFAQITDIHTAYRDEMRVYQAGVYIPGVTMVKTEGILYDGDHTDDSGYLTMSQRFIEALRG